MTKKILNILLCAVLAASVTASLAACGKAPGQESTPGSQDGQSSSAETPSGTSDTQ